MVCWIKDDKSDTELLSAVCCFLRCDTATMVADCMRWCAMVVRWMLQHVTKSYPEDPFVERGTPKVSMDGRTIFFSSCA